MIETLSLSARRDGAFAILLPVARRCVLHPGWLHGHISGDKQLKGVFVCVHACVWVGPSEGVMSE